LLQSPQLLLLLLLLLLRVCYERVPQSAIQKLQEFGWKQKDSC
jgi:hypothetical protein